jgi:hypothetical protein
VLFAVIFTKINAQSNKPPDGRKIVQSGHPGYKYKFAFHRFKINQQFLTDFDMFAIYPTYLVPN